MAGVHGSRLRPVGRHTQDILQPGEKVLYSTNVHWIPYLAAMYGVSEEAETIGTIALPLASRSHITA
jgi:hypothetical protein